MLTLTLEKLCSTKGHLISLNSVCNITVMLSDCCVLLWLKHTKFTVFICIVSNPSREVSHYLCVLSIYGLITLTVSSCTEISFSYSTLISCLNSLAEASAAEKCDILNCSHVSSAGTCHSVEIVPKTRSFLFVPLEKR